MTAAESEREDRGVVLMVLVVVLVVVVMVAPGGQRACYTWRAPALIVIVWMDMWCDYVCGYL